MHTMRTMLACAVAALCAPAFALDFDGYFRVGPGGTTTSGAARACYGLPGEGLKFRLGNECDLYGEFLLGQRFETAGVQVRAAVMANVGDSHVDDDDAEFGVNQLFVEAKGFDVAPNASFWIGKRFHGRADVHIVDTFFTNLSGVGAGIGDVAAGPGKLAFAWFRSDLDNKRSGHRLNVEYDDLPFNRGGKLRLVGTLTRSEAGGRGGAAFTVQHTQADFPAAGGTNTAWLQVARGSAALNGNFGDPGAASGDKAWRLVESFAWQRGAFGAQAIAMLQRDLPDAAPKVAAASIGGRAAYAFTRHFKLVAELGYSQRKPQGGPTARLAKFTIAPTLSTGPGFFDRPELRLYVTTAKWNAAAGNVTGVSAFDGRTRGTSYGVQAEMWF